MKNTQEITRALEQLLNSNTSMVNCYRDITERIKDDKMKRFLKACTEQREHFITDLKEEINIQQGALKTVKSGAGKLSRIISKIKKNMGVNEDSLLRLCQQCEIISWREYNAVLGYDDIPFSCRALLKDHKSKIDDIIYQLQELKASYSVV